MNILFLGCLFNKSDEAELLNKSKIGLSNAVNTYQWNLIKGLDDNLERRVTVFNIIPVGTFPKYFRRLFLKSKAWAHIDGAKDYEIGSINLSFLKQLIRSFKIKKKIRSWTSNQKEESIIIIYSTYLPFLMATKALPSRIKKVLVVADLPEYYDLSSSTNIIRRTLRKINNRMVYKCLEDIDYFVVLTEKMRIPLNIDKRPFTVLEGMVDNSILNKSCFIETSNTKKVILYTGGLHRRFGIDTLVEAVQLLDNKTYELWVCGSGEMQGAIDEISKKHDNIKYLGYRTKSEIYELQQKATVLINPRTNDGEYTKYSFPSKTMEYMLSGKPVLMYKLDGVPDEYDQYLYYINGSEPRDITNRIMEICEKSQRELDEFGQKAREFVLENKNSEIQAKKIIDMIKMMN